MAIVGVPPEGNFRSVLLNISGIRINQTADAGFNSPGWVTIAVPTGVGSGSQQNPGDLQIDLVSTQNGATVFNVGGAPPGIYQTAQVLVDTSLPGTMVPGCQSGVGVSNTEGCINYPIQFDISNPTLNTVVFPLTSPVTVSANQTAPLVIKLAVAIAADGLPVNTGDAYLVDITASEADFGSFLAQVTGNVTATGTQSGSIRLTPLSVSAELSGTNTVIETVPVRKKGVFTLELPAASGGTSYDLFTSGGNDSYATLQNLTVMRGQLFFGEDLAVKAITPTNFTGTIADGCTSLGIPGAQLQLLAPGPTTVSTSKSTPQPTPPATGLCFNNPEQCVVVASATTDQAGTYPLPGTTFNPAPFNVAPANVSNLAVRITASGYSSLMSSVFLKSKNNQICSAASANPQTICNFSLPTGYINGTVNLALDPPPGNSVLVEVFAENSGTNQIVSALPQPLKFVNQQTSAPFTMNVPIAEAGAFDLFAVAIDPFLGATSPFPGHDISVLGAVPAPSGQCASIPPLPPTPTPPASPIPTPSPIPLPALDCVGHGSISGTVINPDPGSFVEVIKADPNNLPVQILGTAPGLFSSGNQGNTAYTLCVPPDTYTLQRFETVVATPFATPIPEAIGTPQGIMVPQPGATSSPCPSSCSNSNSGPGPCPGLCGNMPASPL